MGIMGVSSTPIHHDETSQPDCTPRQTFSIKKHMKFSPIFSLTLAAIFFTGATLAFGEVHLPSIISDHMVLAKSAKVPIWGKADPGEQVTVTLNGQTAKVTADAAGKWSVSLNLKDSAPGPFEMTVEGKNKLTFSDVLVGEVWVASGQSNMAFGIKNAIHGADAVASATNAQIRLFMVPMNTASDPQSETKSATYWRVCSPTNLGGPPGWAGFSAVAYFFARDIQQKTGAPVGMIGTYLGGTPSEAWTSTEAINCNPDLKAATERRWTQIKEYPEKKKAFVDGMKAWLQANAREDKPVTDTSSYAGNDVTTKDWIPVKLPGEVMAPGLTKTGAVWLRKEITIPKKSGANLPLRLAIDGYDSVYWNGKLLKQTTYESFEGTGSTHAYGPYDIPPGEVKEGKNILAIRLYEPVEPANFSHAPIVGSSTLTGELWQAKAEYAFPDLSVEKIAAAPKPPANPPTPQNVGSSLFNGMIQPLLPYAISGVIWYQGESNSDRAYQYRMAFPLMITDWRKQWNQGEFPFYFCQLPTYFGKKEVPAESSWAELREAQSLALKLPNTGQAVLIDLGESADIHPPQKQEVGERLALIALAKNYGKTNPCSGPVYDSMKIDQGKAILTFTQTDGGLVAKPLPQTYTVRSLAQETAPLVRNSPNSQIEGFAICGDDKKWVWADAKIDGNSVVVWSDNVPAPVAVRYAWSDNPTCNLYSGAGLPASPFRTDDFPLSTTTRKY